MGNPFENDPPPAWMTDEVRQATWDTYGPGCAQEPGGNYCHPETNARWARMTAAIDSMDAYKHWIDGYDCGIYYADKMVGQLLDKLDAQGILDDTMIIVSSDHGENQGELSVYGDHQTGDHITNRVPLIIRHPQGVGGKGRVDKALHYQFDYAATVIEMLGGTVPGTWDGVSFRDAFEKEEESGRDFLVVANCAWACQRAARWDDYIMIRTFHSGFKNYPDIMLFNLAEDPHELNNLAGACPELVAQGLAKLEQWTTDEMRRSQRTVDPMWIVMREGGPLHARFTSPQFANYKERLRQTGREEFAAELDRRADRLTTWPH